MTTHRRWWIGLFSLAAVACGDDGGVSSSDGTETGSVDDTTTASTSTTTTGDTDTVSGTGTDTAADVCGDGVLTGDETCDDGNTDPDDGCAADCTQEAGWSCEGEPSTCTAVCGDGALAGEETCDDGNTEAGDGCSDACAEEPGWYCDEEPSVCATMCGDDIAAGEEACDGTDLLGTDCFALGGAADGTLACDENCAFDIEGCLTFPGDLCIDPFPIDGTDFTDDDDSLDYNPDYGYGANACPGEAMGYGSAAPDVVYLANSTADGTWRFDLTKNWDSTLYVTTNCADIDNACVAAHEAPLAGTPETLTLLLTANTNYYVIVDGFSNMSATNGGNFSFAATRLGDTCDEPNTIDPASLPFTFNGDTTLVQTADYTADMGACGVSGGDGDDAAFSFTPDADGDYQITVTPSGGWDAVIYAAADCDNIAGGCPGGANDGAADAAEQITLSLTAGDTIYIVVDGVAAADEGPYELYIESI